MTTTTTNKKPENKKSDKPTLVVKRKIPIEEKMVVCSPPSTVPNASTVEKQKSKILNFEFLDNAPVEPAVSAPSTAVSIKKPTSPVQADYMKRSRFTREMAIRSLEDGVSPKEMLMSIAVDPTLTFTDWLPMKGQLVEIERTATLAERIDCLKSVLPYYEEKKGLKLEHGGLIQILHSLASTALDETVLDEMGKVIDIEDIVFEEDLE